MGEEERIKTNRLQSSQAMRVSGVAGDRHSRRGPRRHERKAIWYVMIRDADGIGLCVSAPERM